MRKLCHPVGPPYVRKRCVSEHPQMHTRKEFVQNITDTFAQISSQNDIKRISDFRHYLHITT